VVARAVAVPHRLTCLLTSMLSVGVRARVLRATYRTTSGPCRSRVPWGTDATVRRAVVSTIGSCACFCLSLLVGKALAQALWPERLEAFAEEARARLFPAPRPACASEVAALRVAEPRWCALKSLRLRARNSAAKHPGLYVHADAHACITGRLHARVAAARAVTHTSINSYQECTACGMRMRQAVHFWYELMGVSVTA